MGRLGHPAGSRFVTAMDFGAVECLYTFQRCVPKRPKSFLAMPDCLPLLSVARTECPGGSCHIKAPQVSLMNGRSNLQG